RYPSVRLMEQRGQSHANITITQHRNAQRHALTRTNPGPLPLSQLGSAAHALIVVNSLTPRPSVNLDPLARCQADRPADCAITDADRPLIYAATSGRRLYRPHRPNILIARIRHLRIIERHGPRQIERRRT